MSAAYAKKLDAVRNAVAALSSDTSVPAPRAIDDLEELIEEMEMRIEALKVGCP